MLMTQPKLLKTNTVENISTKYLIINRDFFMK